MQRIREKKIDNADLPSLCLSSWNNPGAKALNGCSPKGMRERERKREKERE